MISAAAQLGLEVYRRTGTIKYRLAQTLPANFAQYTHQNNEFFTHDIPNFSTAYAQKVEKYSSWGGYRPHSRPRCTGL